MKLEKERAADFNNRREAVRFDLKVDGLFGSVTFGVRISTSLGDGIGSGSTSGGSDNRGWSRTQSSAIEEDGVFCFLSLPLRVRIDMPGVEGLLAEQTDSASVSREGIDSLDNDRTDDRGPVVMSLPALIFSGSSSFGGL